MPHDKKTKLFGGMIGIIKSIRQRVGENGCGFFKRDVVLCEIARCFLFIPVK